MNKPTISDEYKKKLIRAIEYHYPHAKIILFGSWATGKAKPASDIDLAIDIGEKIPLVEIGRMRVTMDNLDILNLVDIVDMNSNIPAELKNNILKDGIVWKD